MKSASAMRRRELAFRGFAVLLGLAGSLIVGEAVTRILAPDWLDYRMKFLASGQAGGDGGSDLGWPVETVDGQFLRFKPNQEFRVANPEYRHGVHIDELGGRTTCAIAGGAPAGSVMLLGDSFTLGIGVEDCETFASLLALQHPESRIVNLGVSGTALPQQLFIASKRFTEFGQARAYLFFFFLGNDYDGMIDAQPYSWNAPERTEGKSAVSTDRATAPSQFIEALNGLFHRRPISHSYLLQISRTVALRAFLGRRATSVDPIFKGMFVRNDQYVDAMRTALRQNLSYLKTLVESTGTEALLVAIPDRYQLIERIRNSQAEYYGIPLIDLDRFLPNRILAQETAIAGIPLIDPSECLDRLPEKSKFYYTGDNHFTPAGHRAFFHCIKDPIGAMLQGGNQLGSRTRADRGA